MLSYRFLLVFMATQVLLVFFALLSQQQQQHTCTTTTLLNKASSIYTPQLYTQYDDVCHPVFNALHAHFMPRQVQFTRREKRVKAYVWECQGECEGFGDRITGMVSTFMLAVLDDRAFFIDHHKPQQLGNFYGFRSNLSEKASWVYQEELTQGLTVGREYTINNYKAMGKRYLVTNFSKEITADAYFFTSNLPVQNFLLQNRNYERNIRKYGFDHINYIDLYGCVMKYLFNPQGDLESAISQWENVFKNNYIIGIQVRLGGKSVAWRDPVRVPKDKVLYFWDCALQIEKHILRENVTSKPIKWFLTTDSNDVISEGQRLYKDKILITNGIISHVHKSSVKDAKQGFLKAVLDFNLLSMSDSLIISRSTFGERASLYGMKRAYYLDSFDSVPVCSPESTVADFTRWWHVDIPAKKK